MRRLCEQAYSRLHYYGVYTQYEHILVKRDECITEIFKNALYEAPYYIFYRKQENIWKIAHSLLFSQGAVMFFLVNNQEEIDFLSTDSSRVS